MTLSIAFVIPWFGPELKGGAEQHAWQMATRLSIRGHEVSVLTTCSESFLGSWEEDFYKPGLREENGLKVHRFPLDRRDRQKFDALNSKLMMTESSTLVPGISPCSDAEEAVFLDENIFSSELDNFISKQKASYDYFVFLPYLFPNILRGIEHVSEKAILQPCLHDESYAYMKCVARAMRTAKHLVFNSVGEEQLAASIVGPEIYEKSLVAHAGIEIDWPITEPAEVEVSGPYLLCLGRRDRTKNTHLLVEAFREYQNLHRDSALRLVLAGPGNESFDVSNVIDLGLVSEATKLHLLNRCLALVNPSENESFSRVIFEAWRFRKPVVVNELCGATYQALRGSGYAGYGFSSKAELVEVIGAIDASESAEQLELGSLGERYALEIADWDAVISRYESVMTPKEIQAERGRAIHQLLPNLGYGDAISQHAMFIRDFIRARGLQSEIFVRYIDPRVQNECHLFKSDLLNANDGLIYHHSIGFEDTDAALKHVGPKALIYHNITPKDFFKPYDERTYEMLGQGREDLREIVECFSLLFGDSNFNCRELRLLGKENAQTLPIPTNLRKWNCPCDEKMASELADGSWNILFVGRIAPNKKQADLVMLLSYLVRIDERYRLVLCGSASDRDLYKQEVLENIEELGVRDRVLILDHVTDEVLKAAYMNATAFVSMSEHEGLGVPLIEAMWFDIPVFAYKSSAVPETLGDAAFMLKDKRDVPAFACVIDEVLKNPVLLAQLIDSQRARRADFSVESLTGQYGQVVKALL